MSSRHSSSRQSSRAAGQTSQLWPLGIAAVVALVLVVGGVVVFGRLAPGNAPGAQASTSAELASAELAQVAQAELAQISSPTGWRSAKDLPAAIAGTRPVMTDTTDKLDEGSAELAIWASERLTWAALEALPETTPALYRKDPAEERGKRLCASGRIVVVRAERNLARRLESDHPLPLPAPPAPTETPSGADAGAPLDPVPVSAWNIPRDKVFFAVLDTRPAGAKPPAADSTEPPPLVVSAIAVGSTGTLVDGDEARVCGVLTGVNLIKEGTRTDQLAHRIVGMFDLPENRARTPRN